METYLKTSIWHNSVWFNNFGFHAKLFIFQRSQPPRGWLNDDVIKWKHFPRDWPFVRGIHRSPVNFPHKGQWRGALMFSLICVWINNWSNNREAGGLRRYCAHYDVIVMHYESVHGTVAVLLPSFAINFAVRYKIYKTSPSIDSKTS